MDIILETPRLYLRRFTLSDEDAALVLHMNSQPEVLQYLHEPLLRDEAHAKEILATHILPQYEQQLGRWAVHVKATNAFIGWCGLKQRPERDDEIDLGYRFEPAAWGKGYGAEAAAACLEYAFAKLKLEQVNACAHVENKGSLRILEKIGMQYTHDDVIDDCPVKCFVAVKGAKH
ncbi:MAG: GNAT family N-acetyltransferase [Ferruginibacter sp.]